MSQENLAEQLFGSKGSQSMGAGEAVMEGLKAGVGSFMEGMKAAGDALYSEGVQHFVAHGAHELASALFNGNQGGSAFVMYPRGGHDDQDIHGQDHGQEQERGGRSM